MKPPILRRLRIACSINEQAVSDISPLRHGCVDRNRPPAEVKLERTYRPCRRNRQGAAVVEFAVVAPVFFMVVLGMIEFGRAIMVEQVLTNAAREGARVAVLDSATSTGVTSQVTNYLRNAGIPTGGTVTINPTAPASAAYGGTVSVMVQISFGQVSWLPHPWFISSSKNLTATSVMRRETVQ
jgi:Flp pilus assembly protein TadG